MAYESEPLSVDTSSKLLDLARACKAAARVVSMYPATHPAIQDALRRITTAGERAVVDGPLLIAVMPDTLLVGGRALPRPDQAVAELATMLHAHSVGELKILGPLAAPAWHAFLALISRSPADIRDEGGITRAWDAGGGGPLEIRQIDYGEVLRERIGAENSEWESIVTAYLAGEQTELDDAMLTTLLEIVSEPQRLAAFVDHVVERGEQDGYWDGKQKEQLAKMLQALAAFISRSDPGQLDRMLRGLASSLPRMSADMMMSLLEAPQPVDASGQPDGIDLGAEVLDRVDESLVAKFVAQSVARDGAATARLAQAFQALVPDDSQRERTLELAGSHAQAGPLGRDPHFADLWRQTADILSSYSDQQYISHDYGRDLSRARLAAVEMDKISDDPPERVAAWVASVSDEQVRRLDQQVLGDLLLVEARPDEWPKVLGLAVARIEQLVLVGDLAPAQDLLDTMLRVSRDQTSPFAGAARDGVAHLASGEVVTHVLLFVRQAADAEMPRVTRFCLSLGRSVVGRLIDALLVEEGVRSIRRLREVLLSFGSAVRARVAELCASPNPSVRRTGIELVRAVGGPDALSLLLTLLDDDELQVQRDALRAIVQTGTDEAFAALREALTSGSARTRDMITGSLSTLRDERAAPLFVFILRQGHISGRDEKVFLSALEALGALRVSDDATLAAVTAAASAGVWWKPFQASRVRSAAVRTLRSIGTAEAFAALESLARSGGYAARTAARAALVAGPRPSLAGGLMGDASDDAAPAETAAETAAADTQRSES